MYYYVHHANYTTLVVSIPCTIVNTMQQDNLFPVSSATSKTTTIRTLVSMMDKLSGNNIPSDSNDERLDNGDGEIENDELYQLSTISCTFSLSAWRAQLCTKLNFLGFLLQSMVFIGTGYLIWDCIHPMVDLSGICQSINQ